MSPVLPGRLDSNRADMIRRATDAVAMRAAGATYDEIAERMGYADRTTASRAVRRQLRRMIESPEAKELRTLEEIRLDTLQAGHWDQAVTGDSEATRLVLKIMEQRAKLLGLNVNESRASGAMEASAMADLAVASMLQANPVLE